jgi:hypothetical protein
LDAAYWPPENHVYALMAARGLTYGEGTLMLGGFQLDPSSDNTLVKLASNSTHLDYKVTLASRPPTYVPAGTADLGIDWTRQTLTAKGGDFIPSSITQFRIGMYDLPPSELEANFAELDAIAVEMYEAPVDVGTKIRFGEAATKDGKPFAGIDDTHTWLVALNCGACQDPAPWYLSVLKPCPAGP